MITYDYFAVSNELDGSHDEYPISQSTLRVVKIWQVT